MFKDVPEFARTAEKDKLDKKAVIYYDNHIAGLKEAISAIRQREWVKIEDIPEAWKEGRVNFCKPSHEPLPNEDEYTLIAYCWYDDITDKWLDYDGYPIPPSCTHAILPPQPPKG